MGNICRAIVAAAALATMAMPAAAADLPPPPQPTYKPLAVPAPMPVEKAWYLKGFIGMTNQDADDFTDEIIASGTFNIIDHSFDSSPLFGMGFGVTKEWLRLDLTGEFRGASDFRGLDVNVPGVSPNEHTGRKTEWLLLANAYWDMFTWCGLTPYVGAGIGAAAITLSDFWDISVSTPGATTSLMWAESNTDWNLAWALHAGLAYEVSSNLTLDFAYRYVDLGDASTGRYTAFDPANPGKGPTTIKDITSHDLMVGLRWKFGGDSYVPTTTYKY